MNQEDQTKTNLRIFRSLWSTSSKPSTSECSSLFSECVCAAVSRTREYLLFSDPKNKFQPSPASLREIFLMTYLQRSTQLNLDETFTCTVMSQEQRLLLGSDFVWALLDLPDKDPRLQIAVQILHLQEEQEKNAERSSHAYVEFVLSSGSEASEKTRAERLVEFCSAIGSDCFALFLFFGRKDDPGNIYGLLSNNLHAAVGRCVRIDPSFIENFFKGAKCYVSPAGMWQVVVKKKGNDPLTLLVKFS